LASPRLPNGALRVGLPASATPGQGLKFEAGSRMRRSRLSWACNAIAPWCLGLGLVVSITAQAGQDPTYGGSVAAESASAPIRQALMASSFHLPGDLGVQPAIGPPITLASLTLGAPEDLAMVDDEIDPRADLKKTRLQFPMVDRSRKGDPFIGLRPGFDARLNRRPGGRDASPAAAAGPYGAVDSALSYVELPPVDDAAPWSEPAGTERSLTFDDGATPAVPLDVALNSATPSPSDDKPISVVAAKPETPGSEASQVAKTMANGQPDYATLIDPRDSARQQRCLAEAVYFEARSEPEDGQAAVAQVVLNRVRSGLYPANVCSVVYQDRNHPFACQFSFACEGRSLRVEEPGPWTVAVRIAQDVTDGKIYNPKVGAALNYHANYVMPYWASTLKRVDRIGHHIFYQLRVAPEVASAAPK
jgi:spore germination cell wall hydrolase CwlJ-like protein